MWNPSELFRKKFKEKAHPEEKTEAKIQDLRNLQWLHHRDLAENLMEINSKLDIEITAKINKLDNKISILLDLKTLKEKIDKMI